jgi:spore germination protein KA
MMGDTIFPPMTKMMMIQRSFGLSYFAPVTPFIPSDQKDVIFRPPIWAMDKRPHIAQGNRIRQGDNQMPLPPKQESSKKQHKAAKFGRKNRDEE